MEKERYRRAFEKVKMPEYLEKEIIKMLDNKNSKKVTFMKFSSVAASIAIILAIGAISVFAQSLGLFDFLLANNDVTPQQQELVQQTKLEATVNGVNFKSREFLFDGNNLYISVEVTSEDNKFVTGDDEFPKSNIEQYKSIGVGLFGGEIVSNRKDWSYESDGKLVYVIKAETKSLEDINVRFVASSLDENGNRISDYENKSERISRVPFKELPLVK